jgi:hypothetical protein
MRESPESLFLIEFLFNLHYCIGIVGNTKRRSTAVSSKEQNQALDERRETHRLGADFKAHFCIISGETGRKTKEIRGSVKNLSEAGFCLNTDLTMVDDLHVQAGSSGVSKNALAIRIQLPDQEEVRVSGLACWYDLSGSGDPYQYRVGVQVTKIPGEDLETLRKFLRQARKEKAYKFFLQFKWLGRLFRGS